MADRLWSRRQVLRTGAGGSLALATWGLTGCAAATPPRLLASRGDLPAAWIARLPRTWQSQLLEGPDLVRTAVLASGPRRPALAQLSDGWAATLPRAELQPIGTPALLARLDPAAAQMARLFAADLAPQLAFPWALNPWVLLLRNRLDLVRRRAEGWELLLDPSLAGAVVLPSSPRVVLDLVDGDAERLRRLRRQAVAFDDHDGLSLLLNGQAEAAVLPRQRVVSLLRRDPRLAVVLPEQGGPLGWNLLLSPAGAPDAPIDWLAEALQPPLLPRLLAAGWVPPLPADELERALAPFPPELRQLLHPPIAVRARWRSLPPLPPAERLRLQALWDGAAPDRS
jgi:hypothetical protein